jgi:Zn-dependent alcohol dehydrogenases
MLLKHMVSLNSLFADPTMEAVQFDPKNKMLSLIKAPLPSEPKKNEVVIRVAYSGICGTDLHITEVHNPPTGNSFSPESWVLFIVFSTVWILSKHSLSNNWIQLLASVLSHQN